MKLQKEQIDYIREKLSVPLSHIDFIAEMTDHFASDVERQMQEENKSFLTAFQHTKETMGGADGLVKMQNTYIIQVQKRIFKELMLMYLRRLLKFPKNMPLLFIFVISYLMLSKDLPEKVGNYSTGLYVGFLIASFVMCIFAFRDAGAFKYWNSKVGDIIQVVMIFTNFVVVYHSLTSIFKLELLYLDCFVYSFFIQILSVSIAYIKEKQKGKIVEV